MAVHAEQQVADFVGDGQTQQQGARNFLLLAESLNQIVEHIGMCETGAFILHGGKSHVAGRHSQGDHTARNDADHQNGRVSALANKFLPTG